jgi:hypothetical protein
MEEHEGDSKDRPIFKDVKLTESEQVHCNTVLRSNY